MREFKCSNCGSGLGSIHYTKHDGRGPLVLEIEGQQAAARISGFAVLTCSECGYKNKWHPNREALREMLRSRAQRSTILDLLFRQYREEIDKNMDLR